MQIKFIESFLQLYDELNISKTSTQLFITQQGLSKQIKSLEKELDVVLFQRSKFGVTPTDICKQIYPHFQSIYEEYCKSMDVIDKHNQKKRQSISIAFAHGLSNGVNTDFIFNYQKNNLDVDIQIQDYSKQICIQKLLINELDIAFLVNPFDLELFNSFPLAEDYMYVALHKNHPLAMHEGPIDFSLLDGEKIITGSPENALRQLFDYFCQLTNIHPRIIVSSSYSLNFVNAMTENTGITTLTSAMASKINNPNIKIHRLITPVPGYMFCCISRDVKPSKDVSSLLQYVKKFFELTPISKFSEK